MNAAYLLQLIIANLRPPATWSTDLVAGQVTVAYTFNPPLTTSEQATLNDILLMVNFGFDADLTLAEFQAMKPDLATGKNYLSLTSPTNAQTVAALKAVIRVVGHLLRS